MTVYERTQEKILDAVSELLAVKTSNVLEADAKRLAITSLRVAGRELEKCIRTQQPVQSALANTA